MATTKKPTTKSTATKKSIALKRAPAKPASTTKVRRVAKNSPSEVRSFRPARTSEPFFTFRITHQTLYWLILAGLVLALGLWVTDINVKVQKIYDQIDATNHQMQDSPIVTPKKQ